MSFIEQMQALSIEKGNEIKKIAEEKEAARKEKQMARIAEVKHQLMQTLTEKYHNSIIVGLRNASAKGKRKKYINFNRDDFKANCGMLGYPPMVKRAWLEEMCNPESKYLPKDDDGNPMHLSGIEFNIWNNKAFTVVFTW